MRRPRSLRRPCWHSVSLLVPRAFFGPALRLRRLLNTSPSSPSIRSASLPRAATAEPVTGRDPRSRPWHWQVSMRSTGRESKPSTSRSRSNPRKRISRTPSSRARSPRSPSPSTKRGSSSRIRPRARERLKLAEIEVAKVRGFDRVRQGPARQDQASVRGTAEDLALEFSFEDNVVQAGLREAEGPARAGKGQVQAGFACRSTSGPGASRSSSPRSRKPGRMSWPSRPNGNGESPSSRNCKKRPSLQTRDTREQRVLTLLDRAVPIAEQLKTKLDEAEQDRNPGEQLRKEISRHAWSASGPCRTGPAGRLGGQMGETQAEGARRGGAISGSRREMRLKASSRPIKRPTR